jgi:hypothetical protein
VELCGVHGESAGDPQIVMGILLNRRYNALKNPDRFRHPDKGQYDQALRSAPDSRRVEALVQQLIRLRDCR